MHKIKTNIFLALTCALSVQAFCAVASIAQKGAQKAPDAGESKEAGDGGGSRHSGRHSEIELVGTLIDSDQTKQYQAILDASRLKAGPLVKQLKELAPAAQTDANAEKKREDIQQELAQNRRDTIDKVVALLKPEQKIQFDKQRAEWRAERKTRREKAEERAEAPAAGAPSAKPVK